MQNRNSAQKTLIMNIMEGNKTHPTADEIYDQARKADPHISRGTVYRNLNLLVENGILLRVSVPDAADHFDSTLKEHFHFHCRRCHKVLDVPDVCPSEVMAVESKMEEAGFKSLSHTIVFEGFCPDCSKEI
ncbi:transcriptional repressor [Treponema ruminis]|uniref:Fur family peroxide stress response transcriptional regulator n=1 Tax=Treponema ruminis TaxID=744515 RepID=A0A7W8G7B4_9SPIR|nr:transcriptional repressor [Treponema ruminis]MBB5225217.1 Fur family peroxide stress response transcriptional regulator [Treponema ruminis]QSI01912.1 transcriptional repressor [Treponema ruminis]